MGRATQLVGLCCHRGGDLPAVHRESVGKLEGGGCSPGLLSHRHCFHHHRGGRASFSWAGCPQVRVHPFRGPALTFVIVVVVNWRFRVRIFVFVCLRAVDEGIYGGGK